MAKDTKPGKKKTAVAGGATAPRKKVAKGERAAPAGKVKAKAPKLKPAKWKGTRRLRAALPVPERLGDAPIAASARPPKRVRRAEARHLEALDVGGGDPVAAVLDRLWSTVDQRRIYGDAETSHSARLLARGTAKVAQKLGEEAVEAVIEAMTGNRRALVGESADLLYHLVVVWVDAGIRPEEVWAELARREGVSGLAEKAARQNLSPAGVVRAGDTTKLP